MWILVLMVSLSLHALPDDEKKSSCEEIAMTVLPMQKEQAQARCLEFARTECDRIERVFNENCLETSHSDNAIKYDLQRNSCQAAQIKRASQKSLCEDLNTECRDTKIEVGNSGAHVTCSIFRNENNKKLCLEIDRQAKRIAEAAKAEKAKCPSKGN